MRAAAICIPGFVAAALVSLSACSPSQDATPAQPIPPADAPATAPASNAAAPNATANTAS